jgi:hypothetical protein
MISMSHRNKGSLAKCLKHNIINILILKKFSLTDELKHTVIINNIIY